MRNFNGIELLFIKRTNAFLKSVYLFEIVIIRLKDILLLLELNDIVTDMIVFVFE